MTTLRDVLARVVPLLVLPAVWAATYFSLRFVLFAGGLREAAEIASGLLGLGFALLAADFAASGFERGTWRGYLSVKWGEIRAMPAQFSKGAHALFRATMQLALFVGVLLLLLVGLLFAYILGENLSTWPPWAIVITILLIAVLAKR